MDKKMSNDEIEIEIIYNYNKVNPLKIFGSEFVKNNKNNCKIIYENKEYELQEYINNKDDKEKITIK